MKVVCAGEMLVDIVVRSVDQVRFENDASPVQEILITSGGDANNNAVNLAKLGHDVTYLGRIGYDDMGDLVIKIAEREGINMDHVCRSQTARQPRSMILVNHEGNRAFLQEVGTSAEFCFEDCDTSVLEDAALLQIGGAFHLPRFDGAGAAKLLKLAQEKGVVTSMDVTKDRSGRWTGILDPSYPYLDYFLPSIEQASMIVGTEDPREIAEYFLSRGVRNVAVKLGSQGIYFRNKDTAFYMGVYSDLNIVETTGAGDAFCAGFLSGVIEGRTPEACATLGTACSAFAIQAAGATAGMRELAEVQAFIDSRPPLEIRYDLS